MPRRPRPTWPGSTAAALGWGDDPAAVLRERGRVAFSPGRSFGDTGRGFVRVNLATSPAIVTEAVERMVRSVRES